MQKDFIADNIKYLVAKEGLAKDAFGKSLGLNRGAISSYIDGKAKPKIETLQKISEKYAISIDALITKDLATATDISSASTVTSNKKASLSETDIDLIRDAILFHEEQLLKDSVIYKWLELKLIKVENKIHREYQQLRDKE